MLHRFKKDEGGFTLIELLVVILIIGILAAIALPTFLGQQKKGQDSSAKSDARNAVTQIEACFTDSQSYDSCETAAQLPELASKIGASATEGTANEEKIFIDNTADTWNVKAFSKAKEGSDYHTFTIAKLTSGEIVRTCEPASKGGCNSSGSW